jgi:hypothetical protein
VIHVTALAHVKHGATHKSHWLFAWFGYVPESQFEPLTHALPDKYFSGISPTRQLMHISWLLEQVAHGGVQALHYEFTEV